LEGAGAVAERAKGMHIGKTQVEAALEWAKQHERTVAGCEMPLAKAEKSIASLQRQEAAVWERMVLA
jgi:hypothetical protein